MSVEFQSMDFEEARMVALTDTGLHFDQNLQITDIPSGDPFAFDFIEFVVAKSIMNHKVEDVDAVLDPARNYKGGSLDKFLKNYFHKNVAWSLGKTASALLRPIIGEETRSVLASYELITGSIPTRIMRTDYMYQLGIKKQGNGSIPSVVRTSTGKPSVFAVVPPKTSISTDPLSVRPTTDMQRAAKGTLGTR